MTLSNFTKATALLAVAVATCACDPGLGEGEIGDVRVMGVVQGDPPRVLPPVLDRDGNYYVLEGNKNFAIESRVYVGRVGGGWRGSCRVTSGDRFGAFGWVGGTQNERWYWSGFSLAGVHGQTADCNPVLERDPSTGAILRFVAVIPDVRDAPSNTTLVAMIRSASDPLPFVSLIDLRNDRYDRLRTFRPSQAESVSILGTGADRNAGEGVVLVRYLLDGDTKTEAIFYDDAAEELRRHGVDIPETFGEYSVQGFFEFSDAGLGAAVIGDGFVLALADGRSKLIDPLESQGMTAIGVHRSDGKLYVVGTRDDEPVVANLTDGAQLGAPRRWTSSLLINQQLDSLTVIDDRTVPKRERVWTDVTSAIGPFPLLSAHSPDPVARGTVAWAFAGPDFLAGGNPITQIGIAPVGVTYE